MCRSGNTSDNSRDGDDSGDAFADWNTDTAGVCVVERLLSVSSCDSPGSLPFVDRLTRNGRMSLEVEGAEVPVDQFSRHHCVPVA
jgi:hypothetical protein